MSINKCITRFSMLPFTLVYSAPFVCLQVSDVGTIVRIVPEEMVYDDGNT